MRYNITNIKALIYLYIVLKGGKMEKIFYTVKDFHEKLGGVITRSQVYKMIEKGDIPTRKIGSKIVIPASWVDAYVNAPCVVTKRVGTS